MKTLLLALPITFGLVACASTTPDSNSSMTPPTPTTKTPVTVETPAMGMANAPCHQMPDGSWMGECEEGEEHPHEDGVADDHSMMSDTAETHGHVDGVADDHNDDTAAHDDSNEPPHRH